MSSAVRHPIFSRLYVRLAAGTEAAGAAEHRDRLLAGAAGRVIELGAGHGLNFPHYPASVKEVLAVEPEPYLRERAEEAAAEAPVPVTAVDGVADRLPAEDESFDVAVASLVLCSVPDQASALAELRRVLRPGGELRFYEHVRSEHPGLATLQDVLAPAWPHLGGGCHPNRRTLEAIKTAGFELERYRRFRFAPAGTMLPTAPHVMGLARRPSRTPR